MQNWPAKDPDENADFALNWTLDTGDSIATSAWAFDVQAGLVEGVKSFTASQSKIWLSGGTHGLTGVLTNTITTAGGREFQDSVSIAIVSTYPVQALTPGYVIPTPATLKAVFPAFAGVSDVAVQFWIDRATRMVDTTWMELDYAQAIMLLACHYMVGAGLGTGAEAEANAQGMSGFQTIRSGLLTLSRGTTSQSDASMGEWGTTVYGRAFYWLAKRNRPAVAVAVGPAVAGDVPSIYGYPGAPWMGG